MSGIARGVAAAAGVAAAVVALGTAANGSDGAAGTGQELTVLGEITAQHPVDNAPPGESAGDLVVFAERLSRAGRRFGTTTGSCVLIAPPSSFQCSAIAELPGGSLTLTTNAGERPSTGAITGGTGRYSRARGTFTIRPLGEGRERIAYRVRR